MTNAGLEIFSSFKASGRQTIGAYPSVAPPPLLSFSTLRAGEFNSAIPLEFWAYGERVLAASASEELILNNGSLLDQFNAPLTFVYLKFAIVSVLPDGTGTGVRVGNALTTPHGLWFGATAGAQDVMADGPALQHGGGTSRAVNSGANRVKVLNLDAVNPVTYRYLFAGG